MHSYDRSALDITDTELVVAAVRQCRPDVVVNCAAWTAVDDCEGDFDKAMLINGTAVSSLASAAAGVGAHLVQISTDYAFDGSKQSPYIETDEPNPSSVYGRSKVLGEVNAGPAATIVRTSWVYSSHGGNMVATICRLADSHPALQFVADQRGRPTYTGDLAVAIRKLAVDRAPGIWHCSNAGPVSWFEFAQAVFTSLGEDPDRVSPISTAELLPARPAPRPANSVLSTGRYDAVYGPLPDFRENLADVARTYVIEPN